MSKQTAGRSSGRMITFKRPDGADVNGYLASPAVVAASAIAGKLAHPESIVKEVPCPREV